MKKRNFFTLFFLLVGLFFLFFYKQQDQEYICNTGRIFGTFYNITYQHPDGRNLEEQIIAELHKVDASLSLFNDSSVIARINRNEPVRVDPYFTNMYEQAHQVSELSGGAFDITVAPLVDLWGFGRGVRHDVLPMQVDSIKAFVGYRTMMVSEDGYVLKADKRIRLDASAIAKGYGCDVVCRFLQEQGCENCMVEIGGEVVCRGVNPQGKSWKVGINKPIEDTAGVVNEMETVLALQDVAVATSGNYRQFYYKDGHKYTHTIDPRTGYPIDHALLSATVVAPTCMEADAWATAFMVLGVDSALALCNEMPDIECLLIYTDSTDTYATVQSAGFERYIK